MTIQVEISPEAEARLSADAAVRGMALEKYASKLLEEAIPTYATGTGILSPGDVEELSGGFPRDRRIYRFCRQRSTTAKATTRTAGKWPENWF